MNILSAVLLAVLAAVGAAALIKNAAQWLFGCKKSGYYLILPMTKDCDNAEMELRALLSKQKSGDGKITAVCLDCGMNGEGKEICERFCRCHGSVRLMTKAELFNEIGNIC